MPVQPETHEDTVLYGRRTYYGSEDITFRMDDDSSLNIWGEAYINGSLVSGTPVIDVRSFGAVGDGITDDTVHIQEAIDEANTAGGGVVVFPTGTYIISRLTIGSKTVLQGPPGMSARLKQKANTTGHFLTLKAVTTQHAVIRHLYIDGNSANQTNANDGINFTNQDTPISPSLNSAGDAHHVIEDVYVSNVKNHGITIAGRGATHVTRVFSYFTGAAGVNLVGADNFLTDVCVGVCGTFGFSISSGNNSLAGCKAFLAIQDGFVISGTGVRGCRLTGCIAQGNYLAGFHISGGDYNTLTDCSSFDNNYTGLNTTGVGFRLSTSATGNRITGSAYDNGGGGAGQQLAALYLTADCTSNIIDITSEASSQTYAHIMSGTNVRGNAVRVNGAEDSGGYVVNTFTTPLAVNLALGSIHAVTLTGNIQIDRPLGNPIEGTTVTYVFTQDATGGRTVLWGTGQFDKAWQPDPTASSVSVVQIFHGGNGNWWQVGRVMGGVPLTERTDASAPATNNAIIYSKDNGSGKTQLVVRFPTGAIQVLSTEP